MYSCTARICFIACVPQIVEIIRNIPPLANFRHDFEESGEIDLAAAAKADLILAGPDVDDAGVRALIGAKKDGAEIILLRPETGCPDPALLSGIEDVWKLPLQADELRFRFGHWQKTFKKELDFWQKDQFLECLMNTSPNLIWFKTKDGIHELVNSSFCQTVNKTRQQAQGQGHAYIWNVEHDDPACVESERVVMSSGKVHTNEEQITTGEGKRILITYKAPLRDLDNSMMGTLGIGIDVTRERQYQEKLIQNNKALEMIFTTMDCGIVCHSLDGRRVISANNAALGLLGYSSMEELNSCFQMVAPTVVPEDQPRLRAVFSQLKKVGESASYEYRVRHNDGALHHIMGNAKLVEKDGELIFQRFLLDCTAQKLAEQKIQNERDKRQKELVRALSVDFQVVFLLDSDKSEVLQLLDYPDEELKKIFASDMPLEQKLETYISTCVHPDDAEACRREFSFDSLRARLQGNGLHYFNYRALHEGKAHYFQMKAVRAGADSDSFGIVVGLQSVDSRTRQDLMQRGILSDALKQAKKASQAKSAFLSNMSHDIRTPMNAVLGYTRLALDNLENRDTVTIYLKKIMDSGSHLISLINDILDVSHIESGKIQLEESACDLMALLREIWNIIKPTADAKSQQFRIDMDNIRDSNISCDKLRLKQALLNLLSNAVKYTGQGGSICLSIAQLDCQLPGHATYEMRVSDNGMGMSREFIDHLYEPFERAQNSAMAGIQGTGLGMAITKDIVDMMKGEIKVKSEPGAGTEFTLLLTFRTLEKGVRPAVETPATEIGEGDPSVRGGRILLVEDNAMNQEIAYEFLTRAGYSVEIVNNGQEAVNRIESVGVGKYDIILMDVQMPVLDGYSATGLIRALPQKGAATIPIIAMTANSFEEDRVEALNRGMNGHIAKPIDFRKLFGTLDSFLAGQGAVKPEKTAVLCEDESGI